MSCIYVSKTLNKISLIMFKVMMVDGEQNGFAEGVF